MKNFERYNKEIRKVDGGGCDFKKKHVLGCNCDGLTCNKCWNKFLDWLMSEYKQPQIDWSKVPVDTPVIVWDSVEDKYNRYFAEYKNGKIFVFFNGVSSWSKPDASIMEWDYAELARPEDIEKYSI